MAEVYPFIGTRFNSQLIGNLSKVICPPADAVAPDMENELHERHEQNIIRLEKGRAEAEDDRFSNRYTRAANILGTWRSDGVFIEDEKPSFYLLQQVFTGADGEQKQRTGFVAKVRLEEDQPLQREPNAGISAAQAEHLELMRATNANVSAIPAVFADPDKEILSLINTWTKDRPWEELTDDCGVTHRLWVIQKKDMLLNLVEAMKPHDLFIAEGHHRYMAAMAYRDEMRAEGGKSDGKQPYDFVMMALFPAQQDGLNFSATHRGLTKVIMRDVDLKEAVEELDQHFAIKKTKIDLGNTVAAAAQLQAALAEKGKDQPSICMVHATGTAWYLTLREDVSIEELYDGLGIPPCIAALDACILHNLIINQVFVGNPEYELEDDECIYTPSAEGLLEMIAAKKVVCGFILNPISVQQMVELSSSSPVVPLELGVLSPRTCTGLVLRNLQTDIRKPARK